MILRIIFCTVFFFSFLKAAEVEVNYTEASRIAFFGGSITQQKDPDGYVGQFKKLHSPDLVHQFGYGDQMITCRGMISIDDVLGVKPDFLFVDFFGGSFSVPRFKLSFCCSQDVISKKRSNKRQNCLILNASPVN